MTFTPLPVIGELAAAKTARYLAESEAIPADEDDVFRRFVTARVFAYSTPLLAIGGMMVLKYAFNYQ